jgi:geranylgeranylglycerol-phosphate geranylgeranyltransferase
VFLPADGQKHGFIIFQLYNIHMLSRKLNGMIRLFRPELPAAAGICVIAGQLLAAGRFPSIGVALLGFLCVFAISSSALILNDYFDYEVDRINAPERPLPSGAVTRGEVILLGAAASLVGLIAAAALGMVVLLVGALFWLIGFLYNWRYKESGLPGNLMVCASVAFTFIVGAISVGMPWNGVVWTFSLMAFFVDLGEEIAGDAMDMAGDQQRGSRSIALLKGRGFALRISVALWAVVIALSLVPYAFGWMGFSYLVIMLLTDAVLVYFAVRLLQSKDPDAGHRAMRGAYLGAMLGVIAFLVGQFIQ